MSIAILAVCQLERPSQKFHNASDWHGGDFRQVPLAAQDALDQIECVYSGFFIQIFYLLQIKKSWFGVQVISSSTTVFVLFFPLPGRIFQQETEVLHSLMNIWSKIFILKVKIQIYVTYKTAC